MPHLFGSVEDLRWIGSSKYPHTTCLKFTKYLLLSGSMDTPVTPGSEEVGRTQIIISTADMERLKSEVMAKVTEVIPEVLPGILVVVVPDVISRTDLVEFNGDDSIKSMSA